MLIRYTYPKDVARYGADPIEVPEVSAHVLVERRRAVLVAEVPPCPLAPDEDADG
jgi:hypothetical protein